jgi:hypothetical protein
VIGFREAYQMLVERRAEIFAHGGWCDDVWQYFAADAIDWERFLAAVRQSLAEIRFQPALMAAADRFARAHGLANRMGIHIRHTDNQAEYAAWSERAPDRFSAPLASTLGGFFRTMDRSANRDGLFVATDSAEVAAEIARRYPREACLWPKVFNQVARGGRKVRTTSIVAAATEMILLGRCRSVIGTYFSSFGRMAAILGRGDYWEIRGRECLHDPVIPTGPRLLNCRRFRAGP